MWMRIKNKTRWVFYDRIISNYMIRPDAASSSLNSRNEGLFDFEKVQKRCMNKFEFWIAKVINKIVYLINNTRR